MVFSLMVWFVWNLNIWVEKLSFEELDMNICY